MRIELYPIYSIYVHIDRFYNMDLSDREYYQVRFKLKAPVYCKTDIIYEQASCPNVIYPPCVSDGFGISKTIEVLYSDSFTPFDDCFQCTVQVLRRFDVVKKLSVQMVIEIYFLEHNQPPKLESFSFLTRRTLDIPLKSEKSLHVHRPVFFDSTVFSAVTLTIHTSLVSVVPIRKKLPPDPPATEKVVKYHKSLCRTILSTKSSLRSFIRRYSSMLSSPLHVDGTSLEDECLQYEKDFKLILNGWARLEQNAAILSKMISQLFAQSIQIFARSSQLASTLHEEFDQMRMKRLGELFLFCENSVFNLGAVESEKYSASQLIDYIRKSAYFIRLPKADFYCSGTDVGPDNRTIVLEESYLPVGTSNQHLPAFPEIKTRERFVKQFGSPKSSHTLHSCVDNFCLPLKWTRTDEPYSVDFPTLNSLTVNSGDPNLRRMSDPGCKPSNGKKHGNTLPLLRLVKNRKASSTINLKTMYKEADITRSASTLIDFNGDRSPLLPDASSSSPSLSLDPLEQTDSNTENCKIVGRKIGSRKQNASVTSGKSSMQFIHYKEDLKQKLRYLGFQGYFYSDLARFPYKTPYFSVAEKTNEETSNDIHLIVLVHGLEGSTEDLMHYRNVLRLLLPQMNLQFLPSRVNRFKTWSSLEDLAANLLQEIFEELKQSWPKKLSFIAHSMGGLIIRAMLSLPEAGPLLPLLHTLLTLNAPHCGLLYNQRPARWGVSLMRWWKQSESLEQLCLRDAVLFRDTFLYKLSNNGVLGRFKFVLLVGSCQDLYVPLHSAIISQCKAANKDNSPQKAVYNEMVNNLNASIENSPVQTTVVKYTVYHSFTNNVTRAYQVTGKAAHIAVIDDDVFIERLLAVSALRYFA